MRGGARAPSSCTAASASPGSATSSSGSSARCSTAPSSARRSTTATRERRARRLVAWTSATASATRQFRAELREFLQRLAAARRRGGAAGAPSRSGSSASARIERGYVYREHSRRVRRRRAARATRSARPRSSRRSTRAAARPAIASTRAPACSCRRCSSSAARSRSAASSRRRSRARCNGVRATASPARAATSPRSRPRARLEGDHWVINGQKIWTSNARAGRLHVRAVPHRARREQARGHLVPARADGRARHRRAPAQADDGQHGVQRGVLRRRARAARRTSSAGAARAGRSRARRSSTSAT